MKLVYGFDSNGSDMPFPRASTPKSRLFPLLLSPLISLLSFPLAFFPSFTLSSACCPLLPSHPPLPSSVPFIALAPSESLPLLSAPLIPPPLGAALRTGPRALPSHFTRALLSHLLHIPIA